MEDHLDTYKCILRIYFSNGVSQIWGWVANINQPHLLINLQYIPEKITEEQ